MRSEVFNAVLNCNSQLVDNERIWDGRKLCQMFSACSCITEAPLTELFLGSYRRITMPPISVEWKFDQTGPHRTEVLTYRLDYSVPRTQSTPRENVQICIASRNNNKAGFTTITGWTVVQPRVIGDTSFLWQSRVTFGLISISVKPIREYFSAIYSQNGSNDVESRKEVPFAVKLLLFNTTPCPL